MPTLQSKLNGKNQIKIPLEVRRVLKLKAGDSVTFEMSNNGIILLKAHPEHNNYLKSIEGTLTEWDSEEDEIAFRDL